MRSIETWLRKNIQAQLKTEKRRPISKDQTKMLFNSILFAYKAIFDISTVTPTRRAVKIVFISDFMSKSGIQALICIFLTD